MGHHQETLDRIAEDLRRTYPAPEFELVFEKAFRYSDRANQPDVQVFKGSAVVCCVEIGYTRPEKLELYRKAGIPDIRWYSKTGELVDPLVHRIHYESHPDHEWMVYGGEFAGQCCPDLSDATCRIWQHFEGTRPPLTTAVCRELARLVEGEPECSWHGLGPRDLWELVRQRGWEFWDTEGLGEFCLVRSWFFCDFYHLIWVWRDEACGAGGILYEPSEVELHSIGLPSGFRSFWRHAAQYMRQQAILPIPMRELPDWVERNCGASLDLSQLAHWEYAEVPA